MWNLKHDTFNSYVCSQYTQIYILNCITILILPLLANSQGLLKVSAQYAISDGTEPVDHRTLAPHRASQSRYRQSHENNKQLKVSFCMEWIKLILKLIFQHFLNKVHVRLARSRYRWYTFVTIYETKSSSSSLWRWWKLFSELSKKTNNTSSTAQKQRQDKKRTKNKSTSISLQTLNRHRLI